MADLEGTKENADKDYGIGIPVETKLFFLKGLNNCDWELKTECREFITQIPDAQ